MAKKVKEYHKALQCKDCDPHTQPDALKIDAVLENINVRTSLAQKNELAKYLSWDKTHQALNESANDKAAGLDGIPVELWKKLSAQFDAYSNAEQNPTAT